LGSFCSRRALPSETETTAKKGAQPVRRTPIRRPGGCSSRYGIGLLAHVEISMVNVR